VAIYSGPRRGELLKLRWSNVDFDLNAINFTETKTNRDRSVPMEPIVHEALLELRDQAGDAEYVFTNPDTGTRYTDIKKSFSAACREAGVTNFTFHESQSCTKLCWNCATNMNKLLTTACLFVVTIVAIVSFMSESLT